MSEVRAQREVVAVKPETTPEERTWAAIAHLSAIATVLIAFPTGGLGGLLLVFVPFVIYLVYKDKSRYVADQAAQAFALQIVATVGYFAAILVGVILMVVVWLITGLLSVILIGLILIPVAVLLTLAIVLIWLALPFVVGGLSVMAAIKTGDGEKYRYPYIGQWVADWLARYETGSAPAV